MNNKLNGTLSGDSNSENNLVILTIIFIAFFFLTLYVVIISCWSRRQFEYRMLLDKIDEMVHSSPEIEAVTAPNTKPPMLTNRSRVSTHTSHQTEENDGEYVYFFSLRNNTDSIQTAGTDITTNGNISPTHGNHDTGTGKNDDTLLLSSTEDNEESNNPNSQLSNICTTKVNDSNSIKR